MSIVRSALPDDIDDLVRMGFAMHAESPRYRDMRFDADKVRRLAGELMQSPAAAVFVAQAGRLVVGMAAIVLGERWFGPDRYVTDLAIYLDPEQRGNGVFPRLVHAVEGWARQQGVRDLDLGVSTGLDAERTVRAYERMGFTLLDTRAVTKRLDIEDVYRA